MGVPRGDGLGKTRYKDTVSFSLAGIMLGLEAELTLQKKRSSRVNPPMGFGCATGDPPEGPSGDPAPPRFAQRDYL